MVHQHQAIQALREALRLSPENVPLRQHLADTLLGLGLPEEAEQEYRQALALAPDNAGIKVGLAYTFNQQGKNTQALVVIEDVLKGTNPPSRAYILHARLLLGVGGTQQALQQYRKALDADPAVADADLARQLGVGNPSADDASDGKALVAVADDHPPPQGNMERPKITFWDVGGMEAVKEEIRIKIIHPLTHADLYKAYGKVSGGGILMYGPPGCGKTHMARATAGEVKAAFLAVGINEILDMHLGQSERNLHEIFDQARRNKPCVLFFDEVDALAASRSDLRTSWSRTVINQFLSELDGVETTNEGVLILAATNAPWHLDSAFRRPGRLDRILFVPPPDAAARAAILRIWCRGKPVQDLNYDQIANHSDGFSGADLKALVDVAVEKKLREAMRAGVVTPLTTKDLIVAAGTLQSTAKEWFATARNHALYANQGGVYDDILKYLRK